MFQTEFLLTSLIVVLIPGTGVIYTVSTAIFLGWRAGIAAAAGCTAGILPHLLASILGLSAILHMSALAFQGVKFLGAAYLLYLAWSMWHDTGHLTFDSPSPKKGMARIAVRGFLINILNPKLSIFFLAFLPLFVSTASGPAPALQMSILGLIFMAITLIIFILYGMSAHSMSRYIVNSPRAVTFLQRSFATIFAALGIKLAMAEP